MVINVFVVSRIMIGALFIVSGLGKLIEPYQNFLFVVQNYDMLPAWGAESVARVFPWIEFMLGVFMALGLWLRWVVPGTMVMLFIFIIVVGQAILRGLPIDECGCFGELIEFPLNVVVVFDGLLLILAGVLLKKGEDTKGFSLDGYFDE